MQDREISAIVRAVLVSVPLESRAYEDLRPAERAIHIQHSQRDGTTPEEAYELAMAEARVAQAEDRRAADLEENIRKALDQ